MLEGGDGFGGDVVAVGFGDGDCGAGGGEGLREMVARFGGADEEEGFPRCFMKEGLGERFSYRLWGDKVDREADGVGGVECSRAYDGDFLRELS